MPVPLSTDHRDGPLEKGNIEKGDWHRASTMWVSIYRTPARSQSPFSNSRVNNPDYVIRGRSSTWIISRDVDLPATYISKHRQSENETPCPSQDHSTSGRFFFAKPCRQKSTESRVKGNNGESAHHSVFEVDIGQKKSGHIHLT